MSESARKEIKLTHQFSKKVKRLLKRYPRIKLDLQPIFEKLSSGEILGNRIQGINARVYKLRVKNSDTQKGKSGGYRLLYWLQTEDSIVLLDIYSKLDQEDVESGVIQNIIQDFSP